MVFGHNQYMLMICHYASRIFAYSEFVVRLLRRFVYFSATESVARNKIVNLVNLCIVEIMLAEHGIIKVLMLACEF